MRCAAVCVSVLLMGVSGLAMGASGGQTGGLGRYVGVCPEHGAGPVAPGIEMVHACWPDENGNLTGRLIPLETLTPENAALWEELDKDFSRGSPNRIDVVFVGDGYTAGQQALFQSDVDAIEAGMFIYEPFITYRPFFRIHRVEVVSNESGVDNDPVEGILRDTALDMAFWCGGTERALCVNVNKALTRARQGVTTDVDQVVAIANTTMYGGVGYPSNNLATSSGRNSSATQIVIHELGHSLGNLADEYTYGGPVNYTGGELGPANVTVYTAAQMQAQSRKWFRWLGTNMPGFDGTVGAFAGGNYSETGVYRPTNNSMMRSLARPFNLPGAEALIAEFYREVPPIEDATPAGEVHGSDTVFVIPVQPNGHDLDIFWEVDGQPIPSLTGLTHADLAALGFDDGVERLLRVTVVDGTPWVRDPAIRQSLLTQTRQWTVNPCVNLTDLDGNGVADFFDLSSFVIAFNMRDPVADFDDNGAFDFFDFAAFLRAFNDPC